MRSSGHPFDVKQPGLFAEKIREALAHRNWKLITLSDHVGCAYETIRRITIGAIIPSKAMLKAICRVLSLDLEAMERLANAEAFRRKYGTVYFEITGTTPVTEELALLMDDLDPEAQQTFLALAREFARASRIKALACKPVVDEAQEVSTGQAE